MWLIRLDLRRHVLVHSCAIDFIMYRVLAISHDVGIGQLLRCVVYFPDPSLMALLTYIVGRVIQTLVSSRRRIVVLASFGNFAWSCHHNLTAGATLPLIILPKALLVGSRRALQSSMPPAHLTFTQWRFSFAGRLLRLLATETADRLGRCIVR